MNPLLAVPARARAVVYTVYSVASLAVGAAQVGYAAVPASSPTWLDVALAVVPFVGAAIGITAATHTPASDGPDHRA